MPKNIEETITGISNDPESKLTVQKSIPLFSLWRSDMSLSEFKILDTYLSRINSRQPEKRSVIFTKGELEELLGVSKINKADLASRLKGLGRFVDVEKADKKMHSVALFEEAYGEMDENGLWTVRLTCTPAAMKYIFNIEKLGYLRYKLRCVTSLTSRYTYVLFIYLEHNRFRKSWEVGLKELRELLNCSAERYTSFKFFNSEVLKRCQTELHEKTECRFTYEPIKTGRKVTSIRFTLETLADSMAPELGGQMKMDVFENEPKFDYENSHLEFLASACDYEFNNDEILYIAGLAAVQRISDISLSLQDNQMKKHNYLSHKYTLFKLAASKETIKNRFKYFCAMIENDND